jgi:hypothetical protein
LRGVLDDFEEKENDEERAEGGGNESVESLEGRPGEIAALEDERDSFDGDADFESIGDE